MPTPSSAARQGRPASQAPVQAPAVPHAVLEVTVNNHPGVMSHVCGLFSRRAYNVEGIACMPVGDCGESRIWLLVEDQRRLEQMITQVRKLEDVRSVVRHPGDHPIFAEMGRFFAA